MSRHADGLVNRLTPYIHGHVTVATGALRHFGPILGPDKAKHR